MGLHSLLSPFVQVTFTSKHTEGMFSLFFSLLTKGWGERSKLILRQKKSSSNPSFPRLNHQLPVKGDPRSAGDTQPRGIFALMNSPWSLKSTGPLSLQKLPQSQRNSLVPTQQSVLTDANRVPSLSRSTNTQKEWAKTNTQKEWAKRHQMTNRKSFTVGQSCTANDRQAGLMLAKVEPLWTKV